MSFKKRTSAGPKPENPFDKFANSKKKHEVVNRKVKGEDRNVGRALAKAMEDRKGRLLSDYKASKKSNSFTDRRFGEHDADLSLEDKMFKRFQQERMKKVRNNSAQFNLADSTEVLTHKGKALGDSNFADDADFSDDDEDAGPGSLDKQVVDSLHFGGGMVQANRQALVEGRQGRLDALQEIVLKSKMMKLQKKETKLAQEEEREKLDSAFQELLGDSMLQMKPMKRERRGGDEDEGDDDFGYNQTLQALSTETKTKPADRTKSDEEIAVETKARLEKLEADRLKRMKSTYDPDAEEAAGALTGKRKRKGDAESAAAADNDECVDNTFGAKAGKGSAALKKDRLGGGGDDDVLEEDEEWEDEEEDDEEEEGEEDEEDEEGDEDEDEDEEDEGDEEEDGDEDEEDEEDIHKERARFNRRSRAAVVDSSSSEFDLMPHKIPCPGDMTEFDSLIEQYTRKPTDVIELINRILAWHSVHLPGHEGATNKVIMHNFLDILLKHFVRVADTLPYCTTADDLGATNSQINHLCSVIFQLSQDISDVVAALWGRTIKIFMSQLQKRIRDYIPPAESDSVVVESGRREVQAANASCWPTLGRLLLLRLAGHIFSITDYRHAIIGSVTLLLCQCLTQCPVINARDVSSGLLCVSILFDFSAGSQKLFPECSTFLSSVLCMFTCPVAANRLTAAASVERDVVRANLSLTYGLQFQHTFDPLRLQWLRSGAASSSSCSSEGGEDGEAEEIDVHSISKVPWAAFDRSSQVLVEPVWARAILLCTHSLVRSQHDRLVSSNCQAYPEVLSSVLAAMRAVRPQDAPALDSIVKNAHITLLDQLLRQSTLVSSTRTALQWRKSKLFVIESKHPRFQVDYKFKKDLDPDADRVKLKQLTRDKKREHKAAMRELRRDTDFLEQERFKEKREALDAQRAERNKNFAWMEDQQATVNQQVRKGKSLLKGGGSGIGKKARL